MKIFMKNFLIFIFFSYFLFAQVPVTKCDMTANIPQGTVYATTGGMYKPSANAPGQYFRILIVFAQFESDITDISNWQKGSLPSWANNLIDQAPSSSYRNNTISDYFKKLSGGNFDTIGDIYPSIITVPINQNYGSANQYVLNVLNNSVTNFKRYDNWKFQNGSFVFSPENGDGYLDLVHIIYRWADPGWFSLSGGIATLNFTNDFITHDGVKINGSSLSIYASGITTNNKGASTDNFAFIQQFAHEFGHYLFGGGHTTEGGLMQGDPYGYDGITHAMNAWERARLGYITPMNYYNGETKTLRDYVETGDALKIQIATGEELMIENHQRHLSYDQIIRGGAQGGNWDPNSQLGKGIYLYYVKNADNYPCTDFMLTADGGWNWQYAGNISMPPGWPSTLPLIDKGTPYRYLPNTPDNQIGKGDRNPWLEVNGLPTYYNYRWHSRDPLTNQWVLTRNIMGDEKDAFNVGYNELITPWSNPSTTKFINGSEILTNLAVQLVSQDPSTGSVSIKIFNQYSSDLTLPPSKPQNLQTSLTSDDHILINWFPNWEPGLNSYKIYKAITTGNEPSKYNYLATIPSSQTTWTDPVSNTTNGFTKVFYKVSALDNSNQESVQSDYAFINFLNGQITSNTNLTSLTIINSPVNVSSGVTLTVQSGVTLKFAPGDSLTIDGVLSAQGISTNPISFTSTGSTSPGSWGTITFNGSGAASSNLNYANITYGAGIKCLNGANVTIQNSYIDTCTNGVYIYNSAPQILTNHILEPQQNGIYGEASGMYPSVIDNKIIKTTASSSYYHNYQGLWFTNNTTVYAAHNDVSGFCWGAYFGGGVHAIFNTNSYIIHYPNNRFTYNLYGIAAGYGSYCYAGVSYNLSFYNSIHDNTTYDAYSYQNSTIIAQYDYWGTNSPKQYVEYGSVLDISNNLSSDPWGTSSNSPAIKQTNNLLTASYSTSANQSQVIQPADSNLSGIFAGISFENAGRIEDAIACYKNMIANDNNAGFALTELAAINNKYSRNDMLSYFANIPVVNKHYPLALKLIADNDLQNNKFDEAISIYDKLITNYPNDYQGINAKFEKLFAYLNIKNDKIKATQMLSDIKARNLTDTEWAMRTDAAEGLLGLAGNSATKNKAVASNQNNGINNLPKEYELFANYPNPFNPSTIISYQLQNDGLVTLKIFDALGREVKTLVNEVKCQGRYSVSFDASQLASGVYFYQLRTGDFVSIRKMILMR